MGIITADMAVSADLISSGHDQSLDHPFGKLAGERLHTWMFEHGDDHRAEVDAILDAGAFIMGRNMFTPGRGEWDLGWRGWWGEEPPYHAPVFVLTHHEREPLEMVGTTFHFVTGGIESALAGARAAAGDRNVSIAGGATTLNEYLAAGYVDELRLHVVPFTLGEGTRVFDGVPPIEFSESVVRHTPEVTHLTLRR
ncbi:dihydrofolate reductase family protein [Myceligenerans indicum]|uniref:Dihydrofolate reductase family protein n=1 Tax=Myceligenerans indicum TaxID=2593663 RepID=A0ABS1LH40_9MICO|nr:dihydrofolate reductase family protein [Myceligenerans indicum]MBL0885541.1 dihydrofolate reductase family protein [Myceligenerans indicum]